MVIQLLATELAAAIDLGDAEDASVRLNESKGNPDVVGAAVWSYPASAAVAEWTNPGAPPLEAPRPDAADGAATSPDWLVATSTVVGPRGAKLARVRIVFTLAPENEAFRKNRLQLFWMTAGLTGPPPSCWVSSRAATWSGRSAGSRTRPARWRTAICPRG